MVALSADLASLGLVRGVEHLAVRLPNALETGWAELDAALPDRGFLPGVIELAAPHALGGGTSIALAAVAAAHRRREQALAAWVDPLGTLFAPGVAQAGVDLERLVVARPAATLDEVARTVARLAASGAFDVIAVDAALPQPARSSRTKPAQPTNEEPSLVRLVRKLAVSGEEHGAVSFLLTDLYAPRSAPLPVALRLELSRLPEAIAVRVAKDRRGRTGASRTVPLRRAA